MGMLLTAADDLIITGTALLLTTLILRHDFTALITRPWPRLILRRDTISLWGLAFLIAGAVASLPGNISDRDRLGLAVDCTLVVVSLCSARSAWRHRASHPLPAAEPPVKAGSR